MCGVIGLVYERHREDLGKVADVLVRTLEYRGYDSTGVAIQGPGEDVDLRKDVGAPSVMVSRLGIDKLAGSIVCAQVRWATFGAVDKANAQPHVVRCKTYLYGAHNGNVTNCDDMKAWLEGEGHAVASDNDGEMVVHTVEHFFALRLTALGPGAQRDHALRRREMRSAISEASRRLLGSFSAVIVDPVSRALWTIKRGSSLYFGLGEAAVGGKFCVTSSDLSSVLKLTRLVVPISEGEMVEMDATSYRVHKIADASPIDRKPVRSKLRAQDTELKAPYTTFMEQEIHVQVETSHDVIRHFQRTGGLLEAADRAKAAGPLERLRDAFTADAQRAVLDDISRDPALNALLERAPPSIEARELGSSDKALFGELLEVARSREERVLLKIFDACVEHDEIEADRKAIDALVDRVLRASTDGRRVFIVCCGSSFHAAKIATLFFDDLALTEVLPLLPGELRGQYGRSLRDGDVIIAVSQSGETKDLIDVINMAKSGGRDVSVIALVNNVSSTLAQEKSDLVIPLRCGPEIAVAATKSFINQLTVLYCLALEVAIRRSPWSEELARRKASLAQIPGLIARTLEETRASVEEAARLLYLSPSMHILATRIVGVALEGSLKIREVVLNHTEGFEASEFKHGRNTILGFNTTFGLAQIERLLAAGTKLEGAALREALYADYPLVYVTGPDPRDIDLTVSQINTHKIRGSSTVIVAEENAALRGAATKPPSDNAQYKSVYIALPTTGDPLFSAFSATVVLQTLALRMSLLKKAHLDRMGIRDHGVHPDVPKNVSKSITVD